MSGPKVVPFRQDQPVRPEDDGLYASTILGKLTRGDQELWAHIHPSGDLSLKWWTKTGDPETHLPTEEGSLTLKAKDLAPLSELLASIGKDPLLDGRGPL
jgi:hypothetical protein